MNEPQRFTVRHISVHRYPEPVRFGELRVMFYPSAHQLRFTSRHEPVGDNADAVTAALAVRKRKYFNRKRASR